MKREAERSPVPFVSGSNGGVYLLMNAGVTRNAVTQPYTMGQSQRNDWNFLFLLSLSRDKSKESRNDEEANEKDVHLQSRRIVDEPNQQKNKKKKKVEEQEHQTETCSFNIPFSCSINSTVRNALWSYGRQEEEGKNALDPTDWERIKYPIVTDATPSVSFEPADV